MVGRRRFFGLFAGVVPAAVLAKEDPPLKELILENDKAILTIAHKKMTRKGKSETRWQIVGKEKGETEETASFRIG